MSEETNFPPALRLRIVPGTEPVSEAYKKCNPDAFEEDRMLKNWRTGRALGDSSFLTYGDDLIGLANRLICWNKRFSIQIDPEDGGRLLLLIKSTVRAYMKSQRSAEECTCRKCQPLFKIPLALPLENGKSHPTRLRFSYNLAMALARFPFPRPFQEPQSSTPPRRKVLIHCVRAAYSEHNQPDKTEEQRNLMKDAQVTTFGMIQCQELNRSFPHEQNISKIFSSPYCRALETVGMGFTSLVEKGVEVIPDCDLQDFPNTPYETGRSIKRLRNREVIQPMNVRWSDIKGKWPPRQMPDDEDSLWTICTARAAMYRRVLRNFYETAQASPRESEQDSSPVEMLVVSHNGFLTHMERGFECNHSDPQEEAWQNTQYKTFEVLPREYVDVYGLQQHFVLVETRESRGVGNTRGKICKKRPQEPLAV